MIFLFAPLMSVENRPPSVKD